MDHPNGLTPNGTTPTANDTAYAAGQWTRSALEQWAIQQLSTRHARQPQPTVKNWEDNPVLMGMYCAGCFAVTAIATGIHSYQTTRVDICSQIPAVLRPLITTAPGLPNLCGGLSGGRDGEGAIARLRAAIIGKESGGDSSARNVDTDASGLGQIMPSNIGAWSKQILGYELSQDEFLSRPDLQTKIIDGKLTEYLDDARAKGLDDDEAIRYVAAKWYSGNGEWRDSTRVQYSGTNEYPSIKSYADDVLARFHAVQVGMDGGVFPLDNQSIATATLTSGFGPRLHPVDGIVKDHNGVDFACEVGDAVVAWKSGTVELFSDPSGYGPNGIKVHHGNGTTSLYGHMAQTLVGDGQAVGAGDVVGLCGNEGKSSGPHLHFEIIQGGKAVDPLQYLK